MEFFQSYVSGEDNYVDHYGDFVKPYYNWAGGATKKQIEEEHKRYLRAYDVSELELLLVTTLTPSVDYSEGVHEFLLTCRRFRKHRGKDDLTREIVRIGATVDLGPTVPTIVGVRTMPMSAPSSQ